MLILPAAHAWSLAQVAVAAHDTVLVRTLVPPRTAIETLFFYASGLTSVLTLLLVLLLLVALLWMRRAAVAAGEKIDKLFDEIRPMLKQAAETSESVRKTADLIQEEVSLAKDGVHETGARVRKTVGELADRVDDFNDLIGKVHARADAVVDVAGTAIDGIAWGARKLRERKPKRLVKKK
jgi:methyl-accepting chemotaxis protein